MNRADKRKLARLYQKKGISPSTAKKLAEMKYLEDKKDVIKVGDKVKLNYEQITTHPDYAGLRDTYKEFVEASKEKVFTTEPYKKGYKKFFCLVEDTTVPKWNFHEIDLVKVGADAES